jgi:lysine-N-methylase
MKEGLGLIDEVKSLQDAAGTFSDVYEQFYAPFFNEREYIFENFVSNTVYMTGFRFVYGGVGRLYGNYLRLVVRYALVKFLLIGMSGYYRQDFNEDTAVKGITAFSRLFDHNAALVNAIAKALEDRDAASIGALCVLIKDQ